MAILCSENPPLRWQDMPMPDANAPVRLARLGSMQPDHFWALVAFPAGWQRERPGHYSVDEDFLLLQGDLTINGVGWQAQEHGFVPAHTLRIQTESQQGCGACARFHGRPQWHSGEAAQVPMDDIRHQPDWRSIAPMKVIGNEIAHMVFEHAGMAHGVMPQSTWLAMRESGVAIEAFDLSSGLESIDLATAQRTSLPFFWARWPSPH
jgi:hypothetical protein